jgi:hypothetical protein
VGHSRSWRTLVSNVPSTCPFPTCAAEAVIPPYCFGVLGADEAGFESLAAQVRARCEAAAASVAQARARRLEARLVRWRLGFTLDDVWRRRDDEAHKRPFTN